MRKLCVAWKDAKADVENPGLGYILSEGVFHPASIHGAYLKLIGSTKMIAPVATGTLGVYHLYADLIW